MLLSEFLQLIDDFLRLHPLHEVRVDVDEADDSFLVDNVRRRNRQHPAVGFIELGEIPPKRIFEGILKVIGQFKQNVVAVGDTAVRIAQHLEGQFFFLLLGQRVVGALRRDGNQLPAVLLNLRQ
jgi:hypothetical protein